MISAEDLWDLETGELDVIFKGLSAEKRQSSEDSLIAKKTVGKTLLDTKIEIVTYVFNAKVDAIAARVNADDKARRKQKIMEIMANKQDTALSEKSLEELQAELDAI